MSLGRFTLPVEQGIDEEILELVRRLGADAVRNSDGTELPELVHSLAAKVYATYFVGRGDQEWALSHPDETTRVYLLSNRTTALATAPLVIRVADGYSVDQVVPDTGCDVRRWWEVVDRTTGRALAPAEWTLAHEGADAAVTIAAPEVGHVYTVAFLARQVWDPTQMYNYLTNDWASDPERVKEQPYDARYPETWQHIRASLESWLGEHPRIDVVRFTTFFYHFTLVYDDAGREKFVDWFGYSASVSVAAMEQFEAERGYALRAEDFVDEGYYNSTFRVPSRAMLDWIDFTHGFVIDRVRQLVDQVHAADKEAMMFLGDNWIGTEPYGPRFAEAGLDAVVGSVGSAATCRMIADIPGVKYTEGRFLPYFFPDVFHEGGDPVAEATESWLTARRAIVRSPLDRIGYGGFSSLILPFPEFVDRIEQIADEFRALHERTEGERPAVAPFVVGVLNAWGRLRSWQTHMVAHAKWYRQSYSYIGALEALAGLPVEVRFLSFDDIADGVPGDIGVLVNAGAAGTAFSGGAHWGDPAVQAAVRAFVAAGGGFVGIGDPTAHPAGGVTFQLADVLGVDRELGWGLPTNRHARHDPDHFIVADLGGEQLDAGEGTPGIIPVSANVRVLRADGDHVIAAAHQFARGRAVYLAGLPWSTSNNRVIHRALFWAAGEEAAFAEWTADDARVEVAHYPAHGLALAYNSSADAVATRVRGANGRSWSVDLAGAGHEWLSLSN